MTEEEVTNLVPIRCAGCMRTLAYSVNATTLRDKIYCERFCALQDPVTEHYSRNVEWLALNSEGVSPVRIGKVYGSAHSLVYKTLDKMRGIA